MTKTTLELTKQAWEEYGKKEDKDTFPRYQNRLPKLRQFCGIYPMGHGRKARFQEKEIVITADPWDIVNMSLRGKSWTSCQNFLEYTYCDVWAHLCDPGMIVIFVRTQGDESDKNVDTRVILRYARTYRKDSEETPMEGIMIDRFYGDTAYIAAIQKLVLKLCGKYGLCLFEYEHYNYHQNSNIDYQKTTGAENKSFIVHGPPVKFSNIDYQSYLDNADWEEEKRKGFYRLRAEVRLLFRP